ncbi:Uncharacterised protein [Shigella flexneri]|nr:Uncharacterised protein [Shigella flexneri]
MRTNQHFIKLHALRGEDLHHQVVRAIKIRLRETLCSQTILISDHHQLVALFLQLQQFRDHARFKGEFVKTVHLKITRRFANQGSIAIDKKILLTHQTCSARKASMTRWLSSRVPTVIRRQPLKEGCLF